MCVCVCVKRCTQILQQFLKTNVFLYVVFFRYVLGFGQMEIIFKFKVSEQHSQNLKCAVETTITCADVVGSLDSSKVFNSIQIISHS